jgi:hypothetical protein
VGELRPLYCFRQFFFRALTIKPSDNFTTAKDQNDRKLADLVPFGHEWVGVNIQFRNRCPPGEMRGQCSRSSESPDYFDFIGRRVFLGLVFSSRSSFVSWPSF